jgi:TRAP-type C4-dicarboxylate transport system substrate-binding protein
MTRSAARLATVVMMMALLLSPAGGARAQVVTWGMANEYPATSIQGEADARFAREVAARSGGRIEIAHQYDASSGFRSKEMVDAIGRGDLRIGNTYMGALGGLDPVFLLPSLPFLATTPEQGQALAAVARPAYERALARHNQILLFQSPWPAAGIWANRPVDSLEALRGLRVRTADANGVLAFRAAGAVPVAVSFADALPQLRSGQLDAVLSSGDGGAGQRLMETLRHFTAIEYAVTMSMVTINADAWRRLDPARQQAVREAAEETEARQWEVMKTRVAANYAQILDAYRARLAGR